MKTGLAGLSIEDFTGDNAKPLFDRELAVDRIRAARKAIDADNSGVLLTGRCEAFLRGQKDLKLVIDRLTAYAEAGADCLYAPGISTAEEISAVVKAVASKTRQSPGRRGRPVVEGRRRSRRAPHQRRRRAGADGMDRLHEGIKGDGGAGDVHRIRQRLSRRRTQQDVQLKHEPINSEWPADVRFGAYSGLSRTSREVEKSKTRIFNGLAWPLAQWQRDPHRPPRRVGHTRQHRYRRSQVFICFIVPPRVVCPRAA